MNPASIAKKVGHRWHELDSSLLRRSNPSSRRCHRDGCHKGGQQYLNLSAPTGALLCRYVPLKVQHHPPIFCLSTQSEVTAYKITTQSTFNKKCSGFSRCPCFYKTHGYTKNDMKITTHNFMLILCQIPFTNLFSCVLLKEPCGIFEVANIVLVSRLDISKWVICIKLGFLV